MPVESATIVELTNVGCKFDYYGGAKGKGPAMRFGPIEKLGDAVDLVVMPRHRESQHLLQERAEPGRLLGQVDLTRLKAGALSFHSHKFVALGLDANGYRYAPIINLPGDVIPPDRRIHRAGLKSPARPSSRPSQRLMSHRGLNRSGHVRFQGLSGRKMARRSRVRDVPETDIQSRPRDGLNRRRPRVPPRPSCSMQGPLVPSPPGGAADPRS